MNDRETLRQMATHTGGWVRWTTLQLCFALLDWAEAIHERTRG